jgi:hypothetical protein
MKRYVVIAAILCLLAGVCCLPQVKTAVNRAIFIVALRLGVPVDQASFERSRIFREFTIDDPNYDVVIYNFDGTKGNTPSEVMNTGLKAIRKEGLHHSKEMTLLIFCDLKAADRTHKAVFPYGLFLESAAIKDSRISTKDLANTTLVKSPMNWDYRINDWIYTTNNTSSSGPEVIGNADYTKSTNALDRGWFLYLDDLTNKAEVYAKFGKPKYYVKERGTYSEVYPVDEGDQAGTVRIWYEADKVTRTGCYETNK